MTSYIAIHDSDYKTDFPLSDIEKILLPLNFVKTIGNEHLAEEKALSKETNGRFDHAKCGIIIAFANRNGGYRHYGLPEKVNLIELIIWNENDFNDCKALANEIAERLDWQIYMDE